MSSIRSFTQDAYLKMLSSTFFYPSSKELRPVESKGSISQTLGTHTELFNAKVSSSKWVKYGKPIRFVARIVYGIALGSLVSPVGLVYNGMATIYFTAIWYKGDNASAGQNWLKVKTYAKNFAKDLCITAVTYWGIGSVKWLHDAIKFKQKIKPDELEFILYGIAMPSIFITTFAWDPEIYIPFFFNNISERAAVYKTTKLRTEFGIVEKKTIGLLPYNVELDNEDVVNAKGTLFDLWKCQALEIVLLIKQIKNYSNQNCRFPFFIEVPLSTLGTNSINAEINDFLDRAISQPSLNKLVTTKKKLENLRAKYNTIAENMVKVNQLLNQCINMMYNLNDKKRVFIHFPFSEKTIKEILDDNFQEDHNNNPQAQWESIVKDQGLPEILTIQDPTCIEIYNKIKQGKFPLEIFGFNPEDRPDENSIKSKYRKLMLRMHPDKFPNDETAKEQAACLFRIVTNAYQILIDEFGKQ